MFSQVKGGFGSKIAQRRHLKHEEVFVVNEHHCHVADWNMFDFVMCLQVSVLVQDCLRSIDAIILTS